MVYIWCILEPNNNSVSGSFVYFDSWSCSVEASFQSSSSFVIFGRVRLPWHGRWRWHWQVETNVKFWRLKCKTQYMQFLLNNISSERGFCGLVSNFSRNLVRERLRYERESRGWKHKRGSPGEVDRGGRGILGAAWQPRPCHHNVSVAAPLDLFGLSDLHIWHLHRLEGGGVKNTPNLWKNSS